MQFENFRRIGCWIVNSALQTAFNGAWDPQLNLFYI